MSNRAFLLRRTTCAVFGFIACTIGMSSPANAMEYYTWIDEHGVTHLSEDPPKNGDARRLRVSAPVAATRPRDPQTDYYSIANQNQRMQSNRREREKILAERRLELERIKLQREQLALQAYQAELNSQSSTVSGWRRDAGTEYAEYSYLNGYSSRRAKARRREHYNGRRNGGGYRNTHGHRDRRIVRGRSIGISGPAGTAAPGSHF